MGNVLLDITEIGKRHLVVPAAFLLVSCGHTRVEGDASLDGDPAADEVAPAECPAWLVECGGYCVDTGSNVLHCGGCGTPCSTDEACMSGRCVDLCVEAAFSTTEELAGLLSDLSWVSTEGVMGYATASADVTILSSDLGDGYIFAPEMEGLAVESEIVYGFEVLSTTSEWCWYTSLPAHPSTGYGTLTVPAGTSLIAYFSSFAADEPDPACSDEYYCVEIYVPPPMGWNCCCTREPFMWNILTLSDAPAVCTEGTTACSTGLAGTDHSMCCAYYPEYMSHIYVHEECVEHEHGHVLSGRECTCEVMHGDVVLLLDGACTLDGQCDVEMSGSMYHDWDWGCI